MKQARITIGIDPGLATTGFGVVEEKDGGKLELIDHGCILTGKDELAARLKVIHDDMSGLIKRYRPEAVAVEKLFFFKNVTSAGNVGHGRGVVLLAAAEAGAEVFEYTPLQIKQALSGYGRAEKEQVQRMVAAILKLDFLPKPDDAADAIAAAICHSYCRAFNEKIQEKS